MTYDTILLGTTLLAGTLGLSACFLAIRYRNQARNWKRTAEHHRQRAHDAHEAFAVSECDADFYRQKASSYRNRLFAAGKLTKAEASDHARAIGINGRAKQLAAKIAA